MIFGNTFIPEIHEDATVLSKLIHHEARGEVIIGKSWINNDGLRGVAEVVLNRAYSSKFPNTIIDVALQPHQFTGFDPNSYGLFCGEKDTCIQENEYRLALEYVILYEKNQNTGLTSNSDHYYATYLDEEDKTPYWESSMTHVRTIGNHKFYRSKK